VAGSGTWARALIAARTVRSHFDMGATQYTTAFGGEGG
jgi:hypothetical protein